MLTIYGATGYTGRLIAELLSEQRVPFTIAGRSSARLHALRDQLARRGYAPPDLAVVALENRAGLRALAERSRVLLSTAGPFTQMGPPIVDAALSGGAHYLDITGEPRFMVSTVLRDPEARRAKVALVNAIGFDVVPSDLVVHLAQEALGGDVDTVELGFRVEKPRPSAGTRRTALQVLFHEPGLFYEGGVWQPEPIGQVQRSFDFPGFGESSAVSVPLADLATAPRTAGAKRVRTYFAVPSPVARLAPLLSPALGWLTNLPLGSLAPLIPGTSSGLGPKAGQRDEGKFAFVAEATKGGRRARATILGRDPYGITAEAAVLAARAMLEPSYDRVGALSPMNAFPPSLFRAMLERRGAEITVETR